MIYFIFRFYAVRNDIQSGACCADGFKHCNVILDMEHSTVSIESQYRYYYGGNLRCNLA